MSPNTMHHQTLDLRIEKVTEDGSGVEESAERARVLVSWVEYEEAGSQGQSDLGISPAPPSCSLAALPGRETTCHLGSDILPSSVK